MTDQRTAKVGIASYRCKKGTGSPAGIKVPRLMIQINTSTCQAWGYPRYVHCEYAKLDNQNFIILTPVAVRGPNVWVVSRESKSADRFRVQISVDEARWNDFPRMSMIYITAVLSGEGKLEIPWPSSPPETPPAVAETQPTEQQQSLTDPLAEPVQEILRLVKAIAREFEVTP